MSAEEHIESIKTRKLRVIQFAQTYYFNHPNRQTGIEVSGSLSYTIDQRQFTIFSSATSASVFNYSLDFSLADSYTRIMETRFPWRFNTTSGVPSTLSAGEFAWAHRPLSLMWSMNQAMAATGSVKIGDCTETPYTRTTTSDPWVAGTPITTDIDFRFTTTLTGGGEAFSGGKGDDSDDEKTSIGVGCFFTGTEAGLLPPLSVTNNTDILRLPWNDSWASESAVFSTMFNDWIVDQNLLNGGGYSGSCSLSLDFT